MVPSASRGTSARAANGGAISFFESYVLAGWGKMGALPPLSLGFVSLIGAALIMPTSVYVAPIGARLAHRLPKRVMEIGFALFLAAIGLRFLISVL